MFNFDDSLLKTFAKCEASAVAKAVINRQGTGKGLLYGPLGNAGHTGMDVHFGGGSEMDVLAAFEGEYDKVIPVGETPDDEMFAKENLTTIMREFTRQRPVQAFPFDVLEREKMVGIELEPGYKFWLKRDMLVKERATGMQLPVDHKFRFGQINDWWTAKFRMSSQFSGYIWGTRELTGEQINRMYVNAVSFGKLPNSNRKCYKHKVPFSECRTQHVDFQLLSVSRSEEQLAKWRQDVVLLAKQVELYLRMYDRPETLPLAFRRGTFNESCTFCDLQAWCREGFDPDAMQDLTVPYRWEPWEGHFGERDANGAATKEEVPPDDDAKKYWYHWIYVKKGDRIYPSAEVPEDGKVIPRKMALHQLKKQGKDKWMGVWNTWGFAQVEMAAFMRELNEMGGG
jgi:hypothetical protein